MAEDTNRRDFLGIALGGLAGVGAVAGLIAMKKSWDPLPSVKAAGFTIVDIAEMKAGEYTSSIWRGKPIYIIRKADNAEFVENRDFKIGQKIFTVGVQVCTHLGCIPSFKANEANFQKSLFVCACHGGEFTIDGINIAGTPPPIPMIIPPFKIDGTKIVFGEKGPEYAKLSTK